MRKPHLLFLALLTLCSAVGAAARTASPGPRLLAAEKAGRVAFFLPESHIGSPAQRDSYFEQTIKPAFEASSMLLLERPGDPRLDRDYLHRACADEGQEEAGLDARLDAAVLAHPASALERVAPLSATTPALGRFIRFTLLLYASVASDRADPLASAESSQRAVQLMPAQSSRLMMASPRAFRSVDDTASLFAAYCAMAPVQRAALIRGYLDALVAAQQPAATPSAQTLQAFYRDMDALYLRVLNRLRTEAAVAPLPAEPTPEPDSPEAVAKQAFLITQRNRGWMALLPAVMAQEGLPFYAIGAAHFVDGPHQTGLVSMLRAQGYRVTLVDGPNALQRLLAQMPAAPPAARPQADLLPEARTLRGHCMRVAGNYNCSWADAAMVYSATALSPDADEELLTICYPRAAFDGTHSTCIVARMARPARRGADLAGADTLVRTPG